MQLLDHMVGSILNFWGNSILLSILSVQIYLPTNSEQRFYFLRIFNNICYLLFLIIVILQVWGNISLCVWLTFPWWLVMLNTISCTCWPLEKCLLLSFAHFLISCTKINSKCIAYWNVRSETIKLPEENTGEMILYIGPSCILPRYIFCYDIKNTSNKWKKWANGITSIKKLLHNKINSQQNKKATYGMGENIYKPSIW